jgi:hypothetical protein
MGCHGKCERYQAYRQYRLEIYNARMTDKHARDIVVDGIKLRRKKKRTDHKG